MRKTLASDGRSIVEVSPAPEYFFERVCHIETVGSECIRYYCCILRDNIWQVQFTSVAPRSFAIANISGVERMLLNLAPINAVRATGH